MRHLSASSVASAAAPKPAPELTEDLAYLLDDVEYDVLNPRPSRLTDDTAAHTLRPYQEECIQRTLDELAQGVRRQAVSLPVGSGKTVVFSNLLQRVPVPKPGATRVLVLAHRKELLDQAMRQIQRAAPALRVTQDGGSSREPKDLSDLDVVIASVPALGITSSKRLAKYDPDDFKMIIIDEAHHAAATTYQRILDHFRVKDPDSHIFVWGCSATLMRSDGLSLSATFDKITYSRGFLEMINEGYLCNFTLKTVRTTVDLSTVKSRNGDYASGELSAAVNVAARNDEIVLAWFAAQDDGERASTLVFAVSIDHVESLTDTFVEHGIDARFLHSRIDRDERAGLIEAFRRGEFPVLINCGILTEGTDIPNINCIILARPTRSSVLYQQMLGRGLRLHHAKSDCLVIDIVDQHTKADLVTAPSLLGFSPDFQVAEARKFTDLADLAGNAIEAGGGAEVVAAAGSEEEVHALIDRLDGGGEGATPELGKPVDKLDELDRAMRLLMGEDGDGGWGGPTITGVDLETVGDAASLMKLTEFFEKEYGVASLNSRFDWFFLKSRALCLQLPSHQELRIEWTGSSDIVITKHFTITTPDGAQVRKHKKMAPQLTASTVAMAVAACDAWVRAEFPETWYRATRSAAARAGPISDAQVRYLEKLGYLDVPSHGVTREDRARRLRQMNKAQAGKAISRLVAGVGKASKAERKKRDKARADAEKNVRRHGVL
ncbi:putative ATP-dependent helicase IRC3 [Blastocladiella emersonii ATCC 22665]|nr:putative ATP-dependent helicase IRC3 [Blastocladiella emersonii ATCC 22665]